MKDLSAALFKEKQVLMRAFQAAKGMNKGPSDSPGDDYVDATEFLEINVIVSRST